MNNDHIEAVAEALDPPVWARADDELKGAFRRRATAAIAALEKLGAYVGKGWEEALTPSAETKIAYISEFKFIENVIDDNGFEQPREVYVPWTTIKEIMKAIHNRAMLAAKPKPAQGKDE